MRNMLLIIGFTGLVLFSGCVQDLQPIEKGNPKAARQVLIAGTASDFKNQVITKVLKALGTEDYYIKIIGLDKLSEEKTGGFGAILLVNAFMAGNIDGRVARFLKLDPENPKVIVFYTIGGEDHPPPERFKPTITTDAVTSASLPDRIDQRARELVVLVKKRFETGR